MQTRIRSLRYFFFLRLIHFWKFWEKKIFNAYEGLNAKLCIYFSLSIYSCLTKRDLTPEPEVFQIQRHTKCTLTLTLTLNFIFWNVDVDVDVDVGFYFWKRWRWRWRWVWTLTLTLTLSFKNLDVDVDVDVESRRWRCVERWRWVSKF